MKRFMAASLAVMFTFPPALATAAAPPEPAAVPFPVVPAPVAPRVSHRLAWTCLAGGAGLVGASFVLHAHANRRYRDYLAATDPGRIVEFYDQSASLDRWSSASLVGGEVLFATGVWLRFLRTPPSSRFSWSVEGNTCVARWRF